MTNRLNLQKIFSIFILLTLSFSVVSHSHDDLSDATAIEQLDCKLCQFQVDTPKQSLKLADSNVGIYQLECSAAVVEHSKQPCINLSQSRAPPVAN